MRRGSVVGEVLDQLITSCVIVTAGTPEAPEACLVASVMPVGTGDARVVLGLGHASRTARAVRDNRRLGVNLLTSDEWVTARHFSAPAEQLGRLADWAWHVGESGVPLLDTSWATLEVELVGELSVDQDYVVLGRVTAAETRLSTHASMSIADARAAGLEAGHATAGLEAGHAADYY